MFKNHLRLNSVYLLFEPRLAIKVTQGRFYYHAHLMDDCYPMIRSSTGKDQAVL